jgi:hypothetical protein
MRDRLSPPNARTWLIMRISEDEYQCLHCNGMGDLPSRALGAGEKGQPQERSATHSECRYCGGTGLMTEAQHESYYDER